MNRAATSKWKSARQCASQMAPGNTWRERLAEALMGAMDLSLVAVATCPPGRVFEAQLTTQPLERAPLVRQIVERYVPDIERGADSWKGVTGTGAGLYAPLEGARNRKLAVKLKEQLLAPAGVDGLVNAFMLTPEGLPLGWISLGASRPAAALLEECLPLVSVAATASATLWSALQLAQACGGRVGPSLALKSLTVREHQLTLLLAEGLSNVNIAQRLGISEQTVSTHLRKIYSKLGVHSRGEAIALWAS